MTKEAKEWKREAQWLLKKGSPREAGRPTNKEVEVYVYFFLKRDRDCDNLKILIDALENTVIVNDSQIVALHIFKQKVKINPHCEVEVNEI